MVREQTRGLLAQLAYLRDLFKWRYKSHSVTFSPSKMRNEKQTKSKSVLRCDPDLLQRRGLMTCDQAAHDDVLQQNDLERGQDGTAVQH